jgi:transcriptional regulator with XRE-family HTH domain
MMSTATTKKIHEGRNVKRFREMLGIKQDALAADLGDDWNQQKVSLLEQKETIDPALLQQISSALKTPLKRYRILMRNRQSILFQILLPIVIMRLA